MQFLVFLKSSACNHQSTMETYTFSISKLKYDNKVFMLKSILYFHMALVVGQDETRWTSGPQKVNNFKDAITSNCWWLVSITSLCIVMICGKKSLSSLFYGTASKFLYCAYLHEYVNMQHNMGKRTLRCYDVLS